MAEEIPAGCARPTGSVAGEQPEVVLNLPGNEKTTKGGPTAMIKVGKKAPDFTAPAYHRGKFVNFKLSEHLGKWVILCFYPGDFTFV